MRISGQRLAELYRTQLGQDVLETLVGAGVSAGGQIFMTDMTPEQIALSTVLGIGAAAVGRPVVGRAGQMIGSRIKNKTVNEIAEAALDPNQLPEGMLRSAMEAKLAPYRHLSAPAQYGQLIGRGYGDNIMQGLVALTTPGLMNNEGQEQ